jgi:type IV pilus assembly protein PilA
VTKVASQQNEGRIALHLKDLEFALLRPMRHAKCNGITGNVIGWAHPGLGDAMRRTKGFSLIELLIVVAIILVIAAIAVPSFLRSRIAANESAAVAAVRTLNTAQISYNSAYPSVGFASTLSALSGTSCAPPTSTGACLIDTALAGGQRTGYSFSLTNVTGTPNSTYNFFASPISYNYSGMRYFCSYSDAVVRVSMTAITTCDNTVSPQN